MKCGCGGWCECVCMCVHVGMNMLYVMRPTDEHNMCTACRGTTGNES